MIARRIPSTKSHSIKKEKNLSLLKEEEDTITNKKDSVDRKNQSLRRRQRLLKR